MKTQYITAPLIALLAIALLASCVEDVVAPVNKLVAVAGADRSGKVNDEIALDGSASTDGNKKPFTFLWTLKTKPQGSNASIPAAQSLKTSFVPDVAGIYVIRLTLAQNAWTASDELTVTITAPEPEGPQTIVIDQDIAVNTTLTDIFDDASQVDYLVTQNVDVRADLTVMPGVVIAFEEDKGMQIISGFLRAKGTSDKPILMRGSADHPAYWKGLAIFSNSDMNELEYVTIKQGGSSVFTETGVAANVALAGSAYSGGALKVSHTSFDESGGYGLYVQGMSSLGAFTSNNFFNNSSPDVYLPAGELHKLSWENDATNAQPLEIETGGATLVAEQVTWKSIPNGAYLVTSDVAVRGWVTVEAGASFRMQSGTTINVTDYGYLKTVGTPEARVNFTSTAENVYWNGIYFNTAHADNRIEYSDISNAGLNKIGEAEHAGNVVVGNLGAVTIQHSVLKNGLGYGVVAKSTSQINEDIITVNTFSSLEKGSVYPDLTPAPETPALAGVWLDMWSSQQKFTAIQDQFYDVQTGIWFAGADNPWETHSGKGMGIHFDEHGNFTWLIAEHSPMTGCESYSAEYITGTSTVGVDVLTFHQTYWRSKFVNACDETQNVDMEVQPSDIQLRYEIHQMYDVFTGEPFWELRFINPDNSTFSFFRR